MVDVLCIKGNGKVSGVVHVSGAKNAALPILAACILTKGSITLNRVPSLEDVTTLIELLGVLGLKFKVLDSMQLQVESSNIVSTDAPDDLVSAMRASFLVLGPLLTRVGHAKVPLPGGCRIGSRPVDLHLYGLSKLGAKVELKDGYAIAHAPPGGLVGSSIELCNPSVTATENIVMAAVLAKGKTTIKGGAQEPEITDLINFLNAAGARITIDIEGTIIINGVSDLSQDVEYSIMADRIEAGTFLIAAAMTQGNITVKGINPDILQSPLEHLQRAGAIINCTEDSISLDMQNKAPVAVNLSTAPYPGFPTDLQAQWIALNIVAHGDSVVCENVFENRFMHVQEMNKMGAKLNVAAQCVYISSGSKLQGCKVSATDLRASAGLLLLGLVSAGVTTIDNIYHIDRGYENIESKFINLGCNVVRKSLILESV